MYLQIVIADYYVAWHNQSIPARTAHVRRRQEVFFKTLD